MTDPKNDLKMMAEIEKEGRSGSKVTLTLSAIAGGLAVALLVACIGGGLYITNLQSTIENQKDITDEDKSNTSGGNTYHITYQNGDKSEDDEIRVDSDRNTEMFIRKNSDGDITSISVADFKKGLLATYLPKAEECYVTSGVTNWMANTTMAIQEYSKDDGGKVQVDDGSPTINFEKTSDTPVEDHSILPSDIRVFCQGKPLFWIQETDGDTDPESRKKRAICWYRICYGPYLFCNSSYCNPGETCCYRYVCVTYYYTC